jgi:hypothetical protein
MKAFLFVKSQMEGDKHNSMQGYIEDLFGGSFSSSMYLREIPQEIIDHIGHNTEENNYVVCMFSNETDGQLNTYIAIWVFEKCWWEIQEPSIESYITCCAPDQYSPCSCRTEHVQNGVIGNFFCYNINAWWDFLSEFDKLSVYELDAEYVAKKFREQLIAQGMTPQEAWRESYIVSSKWYNSTKKQFNEVTKDSGYKKKIANRQRRDKTGKETNSKLKKESNIKKALTKRS